MGQTFSRPADRHQLARWTGDAGDAAGARDLLAALLPVGIRTGSDRSVTSGTASPAVHLSPKSRTVVRPGGSHRGSQQARQLDIRTRPPRTPAPWPPSILARRCLRWKFTNS